MGIRGVLGKVGTLFGIANGASLPSSTQQAAAANTNLVFEVDGDGNTIQSGTVEATDLKVRALDGTTKTLKEYIHDNIPVWHTARQANAPAEAGIELGT